MNEEKDNLASAQSIRDDVDSVGDPKETPRSGATRSGAGHPVVGASVAVVAAWTMAVVLVVAVGLGFLNSRAFTVDTVLIDGNVTLPDIALLEKAGLDRPRNVLSLSSSDLEERLEAHPWVVDATAIVSRRGVVSLEIVEEEMVAAATSNGNFVALRADGTPIAPVSLSRAASADVLFVGFLDVVGADEESIAADKITTQRRAVARWHAAHRELGDVRAVQWDPISGITWVFADGVAVTWGAQVDAFAVRDVAEVLRHAMDVRSQISTLALDEEGVLVRFTDGTATRGVLAEVDDR